MTPHGADLRGTGYRFSTRFNASLIARRAGLTIFSPAASYVLQRLSCKGWRLQLPPALFPRLSSC